MGVPYGLWGSVGVYDGLGPYRDMEKADANHEAF